MDLAYFNARVRGMKGRLLSRKDYEPLVKADGFTEYFERLKTTHYGPYIEAAGARFARTDEVISAALRSSLADTFARLWKLSPSGSRRLIKAVLSAWEVYDIKAVIRGIARGVKREEIMKSLIPAGEFGAAALNLLLTSRDIHDLVRFLDTWSSPYAAPLKAGLGQFVKAGRVMDMELNIDLFTYGFLLSGLNKTFDDMVIKEVLVLRVDLANIMTLLKTAGEGFSKEGGASFFIDGGARISKKDFIGLLDLKDRDEVIRRLAQVLSEGDLKEVVTSSAPDELWLLEERFEDIIEGRLARLSVTEPLSIALAAMFVYMKVRETKNLRLLAAAKSFGIPDDELWRSFRYPH